MARFTVTPEDNMYGVSIMILATTGNGDNGNIAVDDITVTLGACSGDVTTASAGNDDVITESAAADDDDVVAVNVNDVAADAAADDSDNLIDDTDTNDDADANDDTDANDDLDANEVNAPVDGRM